MEAPESTAGLAAGLSSDHRLFAEAEAGAAVAVMLADKATSMERTTTSRVSQCVSTSANQFLSSRRGRSTRVPSVCGGASPVPEVKRRCRVFQSLSAPLRAGHETSGPLFSVVTARQLRMERATQASTMPRMRSSRSTQITPLLTPHEGGRDSRPPSSAVLSQSVSLAGKRSCSRALASVSERVVAPTLR